jgi:hypothetical protein
MGCEVSCIVSSFLVPGDRERLARGRSGPEPGGFWYTRKAQGEGPSADPGEEVALREGREIRGRNLEN